MEMNKVKTALVIGGGVAGPVTAMALRKAGIEAAIYEAYPTTADGIGGSLGLAPNGLAALRVVGAEDAVRAVARPIQHMVMAMGRKRLGEMPSLPGLTPLQMMRRADLHRVLHDRALDQGIQITHGKRLVNAEETASGITARFADGSSASADILIGADGIRSTVRTLIDPNAPGPNYTGLIQFGGVADYDVPGSSNTMTFVFGKGGYYLYGPGPNGGTEWGVNLPQDRPLTLTEARQVPAVDRLRQLREIYADDDPARELIQATRPDQLGVVGSLYIMPSLPHWHRGRMVLVGDAVHAPSNSSGQGASLAIESAVQLARCLRDLPDPPSAFAAYEHLRRGRVEKVAARAGRINHAKAPGPITRALMPLLMPTMMKLMNQEKTFGPEQRYEIDWDETVPTAR